jgi:ATP phosphoribosyltransferase regulatory subunit
MLSLRPDVTSSVARIAATLLADRPRPLRICYAAPVFRQQPQSHAEWRRENTQLGCELIGAGGRAADLEILLLAAEILAQIGLGDSFCITINDVGIFNRLLAQLDLDDTAREQLRRLIDTRDRTELGRFLAGQKLSDGASESLFRLASLNGKGDVLVEARRLITNPQALEAIDSLTELWRTIESLGLQDCFEIDLADVSSLDYYTGLSFKVFVHGIGYRVGRGGRYDGLTANFGVAEPAVGFILSLDSLTEVLGRSAKGNGNNSSETFVISTGDLRATFAEALRRRANKEMVRIDSAK